MKKMLSLLSLLLLAIAILTVLYLGSDNSIPTRTKTADTAMEASTRTAASNLGSSSPAALPSNFHTGLEHLPLSLQGTQVDGRLEAGPDGHLKVTLGTLHVFDYFLSTIGEESLDTISARLHAYINDQLQPPASDEAEQLLTHYLDYKQALTEEESAQQALPDQGDDIDTLRTRLAQRQVLRTQYLGQEVADTFFGDQTAYDHYTLDRLQVMQDDSLSPQGKAQALANLKQQLPASLREVNDTVSQYQALDQVQQDCAKAQCSSAELHQARANLVGEAAADRLDQLDQQETQWQQQLNQWLAQRDAILHNQDLSQNDRETQIAQLRASQFSDGQLVRVEALEELHDKGRPLP